MAEFDVTYKSYNVNSKRLLQRIVNTVEEITPEFIFQRTNTLYRTYDFTQLVEYMDAYMTDLCESKEVNRYDIIGDTRNNKIEAVRQGTIEMEIKFQQFNCINITRIVFAISKI